MLQSVPLKKAGAYFPGLDVLRGLAILMVLLFHLFDYVPLFRFGWMGVDLFFVLSGFLITLSLLQSKEKPFYFKNFYIRRLLRTFPLYYLSISIFLILGKYLFSQQEEGSVFYYYFKHQHWFWLMGQNWLLIKEGTPEMPYLVHLWSLAVEEQFYLVWPFAVYVCRSHSQLKRLITFLFFLFIAYRLFIWINQSATAGAVYHNTFARSDSLLAGAYVALLHFENKKIKPVMLIAVLTSWLLVLAAAVIINGNIYHDIAIMATAGYSLTALACAAILYCILNQKIFVNLRYSRYNPFIFLGKISYGLYVFHIPVFLAAGKLLPLSVSPGWAAGLYSLLLTVILSSFSYFIFEKPILALKRHFQ